MKTITVTDESYETIKRLKEEGESFSELLVRIGKPRLTARELFGALKTSETELKESKAAIRKFRRGFSREMKRREMRFKRA